MTTSEYYYDQAIASYSESLKINTLETSKIEFAKTKNSIGNTYAMLSKLRRKDAEQLLNIAIEAFLDALDVRTIRDNRIDYAMTQNSLGNACIALARLEAKL